LLNASQAAEKSGLSALADLARHQNSVNTVRWSPDGHTLASGDTDGHIWLWQYDETSAAPDIFSDDQDQAPASVENWTASRALRGHLQDVVGLTFSPCGRRLASCSTDSTVIVFDVVKGVKVKILGEHKGWVNGVTWDPLGAFITSVSSDRFLRVYKTKSLKLTCKTSKCQLPAAAGSDESCTVRFLHDDTFPSFFRRADFSPDGQLLAVPSGVLDSTDGEASTAHCTYLFSRANFAK